MFENDKVYKRKVWFRYFVMIAAITAVGCMFPKFVGQCVPVVVGVFSSNYLCQAFPSMRPTVRQNCCTFFSLLFALGCMFFAYQYLYNNFSWLVEKSGPATLIDLIVIISIVILPMMVFMYIGCYIAVCVSILLFGRGEIGYLSVNQYIFKDFWRQKIR